MKATDRRKCPRLTHSFQVQLVKEGLDHSFEGISDNLSQRGAFIRIHKWRSFRVKDRAKIVFLLPPEYTGQEETIRLQGGGVITRIDPSNTGIGVEFTRSLKQFERVVPPKAVMALSS